MSDEPTLFGHQVGDGLDDERRHCRLALKLLRQMRRNGAEIRYSLFDGHPVFISATMHLTIDNETAEFLEGLWNS